MRFFRNRYIIGALCIILALAFSFVLLPFLNKSKESTVMVVVAQHDIMPGSEISAQDVTLLEMGAYNLTPKAIRDKALVVGKYAKSPITAGDFIFQEKLSDVRFTSLMERSINEGKRLLTISLDSVASGVGGHPQSGDVVAVACYVPEQQISESTPDGYFKQTTIPASIKTPESLSRITLYSLENSAAKSVSEDDSGSVIAEYNVAKTATLIVTDAQAREILMSEYTGKIHLMLVSRGEDSK